MFLDMQVDVGVFLHAQQLTAASLPVPVPVPWHGVACLPVQKHFSAKHKDIQLKYIGEYIPPGGGQRELIP